jgi:hypothetical protein
MRALTDFGFELRISIGGEGRKRKVTKMNAALTDSGWGPGRRSWRWGKCGFTEVTSLRVDDGGLNRS